LHPSDDRPAIPASSIRGIFRHRIENILRSRNYKVCEATDPDKMCKDINDSCIVCKYFGSPRIRSSLIFEDSKLEESIKSSRIGVGIDRRRRIAKEDHLFSYEVCYGKEFKVNVRGQFLNEEEALTACALIFIGARAQYVIGGGDSRGLGWIEMKSFKAILNEQEVNMEALKGKLREVLKA
jgi:CRISPR/Cas system CSM-associated protein Csm3 (group 7 of RAMP superfamily)